MSLAWAEEAALLGQLSEARGLSGNEGEVRDILRPRLEAMGFETKTDSLGNLIAFRSAVKGATRRGPRVMLAAHMDEVGLMVSAVDKTGLLRFQPVGGVDPRVLVAKRVLVGRDRIPGVIGAKPIHLQEPEEQKKSLRIQDLYLDIGAKDKEEAEKAVRVGDPVTFATSFSRLGTERVKGKAFDDRAGCAVLLGVLGEEFSLPVYGVFTVQEEVGLRGGRVAAYALEPEIAVVLEGTVCSDTPGSDEHAQGTVLGKGPAISVMDAGTIYDRRVVKRLVQVAEKAGIPHQFRRTTGGANDAGRIHLARAGTPVGALSVPCRYIHAPVSILDLGDLAHARRLLSAFLHSLEEGWEK